MACYLGIGQGWVLIQRLSWESILLLMLAELSSLRAAGIRASDPCWWLAGGLPQLLAMGASSTWQLALAKHAIQKHSGESPSKMEATIFYKLIPAGNDLLRAVRMQNAPPPWCFEYPCTVHPTPINPHGDSASLCLPSGFYS